MTLHLHDNHGVASAAMRKMVRPEIRGKFLFVGGEKLYVKGVTYGVFNPADTDCEYHEPGIVDRDFTQMEACGINAVRTYTVPPRWLLDSAQRHGLRVMVGIPWEQHVTFLDDSNIVRRIERNFRQGVRQCAGHPAVLGYAIGNEIPAPIVRWHGRKRIERFLRRLYALAKKEDSDALVTYVNYPSTEYLQLPFLDFSCFNVYLESQVQFSSYLARLQNITGDIPLLMAEIGLDSLRNGEQRQAEVLDWQVRTTFSSGCAGAFVFAWTDEWFRGGEEIEDWAFGLTDRKRRPKPALESVSQAYGEVPFRVDGDWPRISVVVCTYNGRRTIRNCLEGLMAMAYPNYEVVVVNDGSTDDTPAIVGEFPVRRIDIDNGGLSNARNVGMREATGEIVAYIDDDVRPDPHWLYYVAHAFMTTEHVGIGGPNIPPPEDGFVAQCVAKAPGGPNHVLWSDGDAEHIPGCNMAFRREALAEINGFDTRFRIAGDDVDLCWRLQANGGSLGFHAGAAVLHHRRNDVGGYLRQQRNYGKAEAMLEAKWPHKHNRFGHVSWQGRIYGAGLTLPLFLRRCRIYHGVWGTGPFQSLYGRLPGVLHSLPLMPEWYLFAAALTGVTLCGIFWRPLFLCWPLAALAAGAPVLQAALSWGASRGPRPKTWASRCGQRMLVTFLHLAQPVERLAGRFSLGLTPWRRRGVGGFSVPRSRVCTIWSERWVPPERRIESLESELQRLGCVVVRGGATDRWDLEVQGGIFGTVRTVTAVEEHGGGKQLVRFRSWPKVGPATIGFFLILVGGALAAGLSGRWFTCSVLSLISGVLAAWTFADCASATALYLRAVRSQGGGSPAGDVCPTCSYDRSGADS